MNEWIKYVLEKLFSELLIDVEENIITNCLYI